MCGAPNHQTPGYGGCWGRRAIGAPGDGAVVEGRAGVLRALAPPLLTPHRREPPCAPILQRRRTTLPSLLAACASPSLYTASQARDVHVCTQALQGAIAGTASQGVLLLSPAASQAAQTPSAAQRKKEKPQGTLQGQMLAKGQGAKVQRGQDAPEGSRGVRGKRVSAAAPPLAQVCRGLQLQGSCYRTQPAPSQVEARGGKRGPRGQEGPERGPEEPGERISVAQRPLYTTAATQPQIDTHTSQGKGIAAAAVASQSAPAAHTTSKLNAPVSPLARSHTHC